MLFFHPTVYLAKLYNINTQKQQKAEHITVTNASSQIYVKLDKSRIFQQKRYKFDKSIRQSLG
ncbi:hypothetical protein EA58_19300 [Photobacterium galatheae]|uniref:Uncharacterized protein n=1 Tax=Photobacterium galatheae TaxID=1654360 RepID=A0A066RQX3_9GAMM|nr:hypothetical protein EA58_19300 [Photobacterium galatheae]